MEVFIYVHVCCLYCPISPLRKNLLGSKRKADNYYLVYYGGNLLQKYKLVRSAKLLLCMKGMHFYLPFLEGL